MDLVFPVVITTDENDISALLGGLHTKVQEELLVSSLNLFADLKNNSSKIKIYSTAITSGLKERTLELLKDKEFSDFNFYNLTDYLYSPYKEQELVIFSDLSKGLSALNLLEGIAPSHHNLDKNIESKFRNSTLDAVICIKKSLKNKLESLREKLKDVPKVLVNKFELAENIFNIITSYNFEYKSLSYLNLISLLKTEVSSLLASHVLLDSINHEGEDPTIGWSTATKELQENGIHLARVENPFCYINLGKNNQINSIEYLPRRILIGHSEPQISISINDIDPASVYDLPSRIMRQNPDKFGIRLDQNTPLGILSRTIYINGGMGSFGNHATTGFSVDFWLDENKKISPSSFYNLNYSIDLSGNEDSFSARPLLSVGGESKSLYRFINGEINLEKIEGGLSGIRLIDGSSHLVIDLRLSYQVSRIKLSKQECSLNGISLNVVFESPLTNITSEKPIKSLFVSIY